MNFKVFTRSLNDEYYNLMRSLLPQDWNFERCTQFNEWWHAKDYIHHILSQPDLDFVVNMDEDFFCIHPGQILRIMREMKQGNYSHCGMPDRHLSCHRFNLFTVFNPFFNIFYMPVIRTFYTGAMQTTEAMNIEPYNSIFLELAFFGKPLQLSGSDHSDGITTILETAAGTPIGLHTWYSREPSHRSRILNRYNDVKE